MKHVAMLILLGISAGAFAGADARQERIQQAIEAHKKDQPDIWEALVYMTTTQPDEQAKVTFANSFINHIAEYREQNIKRYLSPKKLLEIGGVCKDFAVAKYLLLREAGIKASDLKFVLLSPRKSAKRSEYHVNLLYKDKYYLEIPGQIKENENNVIPVDEYKKIKREVIWKGNEIESVWSGKKNL